MNLVLATFVMMTQGTAHNLATLLPKPAHPVVSSQVDDGQQSCVRRRSGVLVCRHVLQPSG